METYLWIFFLFIALLALKQLASILRSLQSTEVMMKRLLAHQGIQWEAATEPSAKVRELAMNAGSEIAAIKAYREQTGLGLKEAKTVSKSCRDQSRVPPNPSIKRTVKGLRPSPAAYAKR